ncbi:MAG: transglutaminase family protein [Myxococcota bacterium]
MRILLQHRSRYQYPEPARLGPHTIRLRPAAHARTPIESYALHVEEPCQLRWQHDVYGNHVARIDFDEPIDALDVLVELVVDIRAVNPFDFVEDPRVSEAPFDYPHELRTELSPFLTVDEASLATGSRFKRFSKNVPREGRTVELLVAINQAVSGALDYVIREEPGVWTPEQTLEHGRGSCRDMATLLMALLRERRIAARFASGYLIQLTDEGMLPDMPKGLNYDVADLHAWCEVFLPGAGWIGLDATSGLMASEGHIPLCSTAVPSGAAPIDGSTDILAEDVRFKLELTRLGHEPRPTAPYTEDVWERAREQARHADRMLVDAGITLTSGGEPTFNSRLHPDRPEWNGAALGDTKWRQGQELARALRERTCPDAATLMRQGKLYPGESLPRWALELIARRDGVALWPDRDVPDGSGIDDAMRFMGALSDALELSDAVIAGFEDPWRLLQDEQQLPTDIDPHDFDLDDPEERRRMARILDRGVRSPVGFALPLARDEDRWVTTEFKFRRGRMYLVPGDSPMGLRLPLDSLPTRHTWTPKVAEADLRHPDPRLQPDPYVPQDESTPAEENCDPRNMRTVLCVEPRDDGMYVFLPPLSRAEEFEGLLAVIDRCREETGLNVDLEGYPPPSSHEHIRFSVTPDPGVLEVNLPVSVSSDEYAKLVDDVFEAALEVGLHSEKYMIDGRTAGSGGGNHLTLGGRTALESPFVRRGDLLASLITFVQHHPSLSYMFNGLFVGPTSQSPRIDEARNDSLYEFEIALARGFAELEDWAPWENDRLYRHLLTDLTGNTHRAEICIDKLFDHQGVTGRQGIVELRAFEMPPHPRMVSAQMFLMRALIASFAQTPYRGELVRWGTRLHDQFLLPTWMWADFQDVLEHLRRSGIDFPDETYRPFLELRCPLVGRFESAGVEVEIRNAIEPWNVLGEELTTTGTSRYVDSSMERIEISAEGFVPERHAIAVNGTIIPVRSTGRSAHVVAGVRFRAWAPPHSLHPHLGIHHPLRIDLYDRWAKRSLAAAAYHVWHPGGQGFEEPPLTRFEASARRSQRFETIGPLAHTVSPRSISSHADTPYTTDMRRLSGDRPMPAPGEREPIEQQEYDQIAW